MFYLFHFWFPKNFKYLKLRWVWKKQNYWYPLKQHKIEIPTYIIWPAGVCSNQKCITDINIYFLFLQKKKRMLCHVDLDKTIFYIKTKIAHASRSVKRGHNSNALISVQRGKPKTGFCKFYLLLKKKAHKCW